MSSQPFNPFEMLSTPWGNLPLGSATSPASTIEELDKRINELKTVEQWLTLNLNLLKTTIQGMEVQKGTLAAIQVFSASFQAGPSKDSPASGASPNPFATGAAAAGAQPPVGMEQAAWWWNSMQEQFGQMLAATQASAQAMTTPAEPADSKQKTGKKSSET